MYRVIIVEKNEKVIIDDQISVCVTKVRGNDVRLGTESPSTVLILRSELKNDERDNPESRGPTGFQ